MRPWTLAIALLALALGRADAAGLALRYIGQHSIATGTLFEGVEFGGISGIDRAPDGSYYALADDRGGERGTPRFYKLGLDYDASGFHGITLQQQTLLQRPDGTAFPADARTVDPEGLRVAPNGHLYWSSEGNWNADPALRYQPFVREMRSDGSFVREFKTPAMFDYADHPGTGGRNNKVFEALAVTPNGTVVTANEDALVQDGPITTLEQGSVVRVTTLDPATGDTLAQYAYELPPIPKAPTEAPGFQDNGLPELLALSDSEFIALERGYASGPGNTIRLVLTSFEGASNVLGLPGLLDAGYTPMSRELLLDFDALKAAHGLVLDNSEGLSWGQTLANGHRTLVVVSDNNFSGTQTTQFLAFEVVPVPEPQTWALMLAGLGAMIGFARHRRPR
ncbi:esterase-like activity of phytase family protein [Schlegelella sp. S2-27]|uniref:Esterase-like activity of phytase family protein n=1 Tax=Caldimonas mangrovi TaxID=2944811 RepID=A0ABT0YQH1_9BURK|nr:esterase-like activity of phytase family protein [Caldimonas mangrovi]MCM5680669.1 esterase-like activity of phytase family protein [Caldimonas mangrovi]